MRIACPSPSSSSLASAFVALGTLMTLGGCGSCGEPIGSIEDCENEEDDDGDGQEDCADADCSGDSACDGGGEGEGEGDAGEGEGEGDAGEGEGEGEGEGGDGDCSAPKPLLLGNNTGNLDDDSDFAESNCSFGGGGNDEVWSFTPAQPGELVLRLTSGDDLGIAVQTSCGSVNTELGCVDNLIGGDTEELTVFIDGPVFVMISGFFEGEAGGYSLVAAFAPAVCGDGNAVGGELCDGQDFTGQSCSDFTPGTVGTLQCSATCDAVTPLDCAAYCANPAALVEGANQGDIREGIFDFDESSCGFSNVVQMWQFTPPAGTPGDLVLSVSSQGFFGLSARSVCLEQNSELVCSGFEFLTVPIAADTGTVFVMVDAFFFDPEFDVPEYILNVEFTPSVCGDGIAGGPEQCDQDDLRFQICNDVVPGTSGDLVCEPDCTLNATACAVVCGDGFAGGVEECDDGDLDPGDGCNDVCGIDICDAPLPLLIGANQGDVVGKSNVVGGFCGDLEADQMWTFDPEGDPGDLSVSIELADPFSDFMVVSVRTDCLGAVSELGCIGSFDGAPLQLAVDGTAPVSVLVEASAFNFATTYTLNVAFTPSLCGDGIVGGPEQCDTDDFGFADCSTVAPGTSGTLVCNGDCTVDSSGCQVICGDGVVGPGESCEDGNGDDGDGCSAGCGLEACAAPLALTIDTPTPGDTSLGFAGSGPGLTRGNCTGGQAREQIYEYTPTQDAVLTLSLQSDTDQGIYLWSECGNPFTELGCTDAFSGGTDEQLSVFAVGGAPVFVVVDGFFAGTEGPYVLSVSETPFPLDEVEPNDTPAEANALAALPSEFRAALSGVGDVDCVSFDANAGATITAASGDAGTGTCEAFQIHTAMSIIDPDLVTVLDDDDGLTGANLCAEAAAVAQTSGTHFACARRGEFDTLGVTRIHTVDVNVLGP